MSVRYVLLLVISTVSLLGLQNCESKKDKSSWLDAFSNRPQSYDRFIAIIKLSNPPLLTAVKKNEVGVNIVDEDLKEILLKEQKDFIESLQKISEEIKVVYQYRFVLNAVAVSAPRALEKEFRKLTSVAFIENENQFERLLPVATDDSENNSQESFEKTSVQWIGALDVQKKYNAKGKGIKVGVLDTGIDYTHKMLGGVGTEEAFTQNDPNVLEEGTFPNSKVKGGIDLVGTEYNSASPNFTQHIPKPDNDPIDEGGHGSHVAGSIAGLGDGIETYDGIVPEADLYSIKVFGRDGSTGDSVIIAGLEYAVDPNGDFNLEDQLDLVNLSLGSSFGIPHLLYSEAMKNLVNGGTIAVCSAGNSGFVPYIVGAPSTTTEAISVAASIDGMDHNYKFSAVKFLSAQDNQSWITEALESSFGKPLRDIEALSGKLVFIGFADQPLTNEMIEQLKGHVALIDRGKITFAEKVQRAFDAGAIGVIVANNQDGDPFIMGGDKKLDIPAIMISKTLGQAVKQAMGHGEVTIDFKIPEKIEKPELIDTLTGFSSRGPRSVDALIKPEVSAPGSAIISALMGGGAKGTKMSGTSMAAPHMSGAVALLKSIRKNLSSDEIKSVFVTTAKLMKDKTGVLYPVSQQGGGRIDLVKAVEASLAFFPPTISLGELSIHSKKKMMKQILVKNISENAVDLNLNSQLPDSIKLLSEKNFHLNAGEEKTVKLVFELDITDIDSASKELDGYVKFQISNQNEEHHLPLLTVIHRLSHVQLDKAELFSGSHEDAEGSLVDVTLSNKGTSSGDALLFNLLAKDQRKKVIDDIPSRRGACDLQSAGYRILQKTDLSGEKFNAIQFAVKLYHPITTWNLCEVSVMLDGDEDGVFDQELLGTSLAALTGNDSMVRNFGSILTNAHQMRNIRKNFESNFPAQDSADYLPAILDFQEFKGYEHSTIAILTANLAKLSKTSSGKLKFKLAVETFSDDTTAPEADDFLDKTENNWMEIGLDEKNSSFVGIPEIVTIASNEKQTVSLTKGAGKKPLVVYMPQNFTGENLLNNDLQEKMVNIKLSF